MSVSKVGFGVDGGINRLMPAVIGAYRRWNQRVGKSELNDWLASATGQHPSPLGARGRWVRLRYATQAKARPPTFIVFTSRPQDLPDSYVRFLENDLRGRFGLSGTPLRLVMRAGKDPYCKKPWFLISGSEVRVLVLSPDRAPSPKRPRIAIDSREAQNRLLREEEFDHLGAIILVVGVLVIDVPACADHPFQIFLA